MLTGWILIDSTREDELAIVFRGGLSLVVLLGTGVAELVCGGKLLAVLPVARA